MPDEISREEFKPIADPLVADMFKQGFGAAKKAGREWGGGR